MSALDVQNDTLTILLCNRLSSHLDSKHHAIKLSKCCKVIRDKTKDKILYGACKSIIKAVSGGAYAQAILVMGITEQNYFREYNHGNN